LILRCSEAISIDDARLRRSSATEKETTFTALESPLKQDEKIYVAGHTGMAGAALVQALRRSGYQNLIYFTGDELDLLDQHAVLDFYYQQRPDYVIDATAREGGIQAHASYPGQFIYENLQIEINLMHGAYLARVKKLLFLAGACIYPQQARQPMREDSLLTGPLAPIDEPYAVAKIAGIRMAQAYREQYGCNFICAATAALYGPADHFEPTGAHVLPALLRRFHEAKSNDLPAVSVWGSGLPRREFLHVDDLADACLFLMDQYDQPSLINIGAGEDLTINELAHLIKAVVGYQGAIEFDMNKPDGAPRRLLDASRLHKLGWRNRISLADGLRRTYEWYVNNAA